MRDPAINTRTIYQPGLQADEILPPEPLDALSAPTVEDLLPGGMALYPRGAAWGTPDLAAPSLTTRLAGLMRALLHPYEALYVRAWGLTRESRALTLVESLTDWERDFGLPDDCSPFGQSTSERRNALITKVRSIATITPQDFVRLAHQAGYNIEIEEPATFECGFSECGGEHTTGDFRQEAFWIVHVYDLGITYFIAGESEVSVDPLFDIAAAEGLECLFADIAPAWSMPVFEYHTS